MASRTMIGESSVDERLWRKADGISRRWPPMGITALAAVLLVWAGEVVSAQQMTNPPRIGYIFPAGGRQGERCEVTIGGQYLENVDEVLASHPGITVRITGYARPLTQREVNDLMQKLQAIREKVQEILRTQPRGQRFGSQALFAKVAQEMGVSMEQIRALEEFRRQRMDPKRQPNPQIAERLFAEVTIAPDVPPGQYHLRVKRRGMLSTPLIFQVDAWPEVVELEPNDRDAMSVDVNEGPVVINGQILPGDVDRFRLPLRKGQKVVFALAGRSLIPYLADAVPGWFQAVLTLFDPAGREVAFADDWRFHPDPVLVYEVPEDGLYTIVVADALYRGREDFVYRLLVGEVPLVTSIFPLGGQIGRKVTVELEGWNLPQDTLDVDLTWAGPGIRTLEVFTAGASWNHLPFAADRLPELTESEPNDAIASAQEIKGNAIVNGRIDRPGDVDVFRLPVRAGEEWVFEVVARRVGSPLDSFLRITDETGTVLATGDDFDDKSAGLITHQADSYVRAKAPGDGWLFVHITDIQKQGGREYAYRLRLSRPQPDFDLRVTPSTVNIAPGVPVPITAWVVRKDGLEGDILLELRDGPAGLRLSGNWIPAGADHTVLTLSAGSSVSPGVYKLKLIGRAQLSGRIIERAAVPCDDMMQAFIYRHLVPADSWVISVGGARRFPAPAWGFSAESPVKIPLGGSGEIAIPAGRGNPLADFTLQLREPPEGISLGQVRQGLSTVRVEILADKDKVAPGLKGNLLVELLQQRQARPGMPARLVPVAILPAIPFEVVAN